MRSSTRVLLCALAIAAGCSAPPQTNLARCEYIVSEGSDEAVVIGLDRLRLIGAVQAERLAPYIGMRSPDPKRS